MPYYAGIGSRATPKTVLREMERIARRLSTSYTLRSGAAAGADTAFENGAGDNKEIFVVKNNWRLPNYFGIRDIDESYYYDCMEKASRIHPKWSACGFIARCLHARNILQIEGMEDELVEFVVYWTEYDRDLNPKGGTSTAVNYAKKLGIPTYNLNIPDQKKEFEVFLQGV